MKPDQPGAWYSRDQKIVVYIYSGTLLYRSFVHSYGEGAVVSDLPDDDWRRAEDPVFPNLPEKPKVYQCFVAWGPHAGNSPAWRVFQDGVCLDSGQTVDIYTVVPHPENDPEAIEMINAK